MHKRRWVIFARMEHPNHRIREAFCIVPLGGRISDAPVDIDLERAAFDALGFLPNDQIKGVAINLTFRDGDIEHPEVERYDTIKRIYARENEQGQQVIHIAEEQISLHWISGYPGWIEGLRGLVLDILSAFFAANRLAEVRSYQMGYINLFPMEAHHYVGTWLKTFSLATAFAEVATPVEEVIVISQQIFKVGMKIEVNISVHLLLSETNERYIRFVPLAASLPANSQFDVNNAATALDDAHIFAKLAFKKMATPFAHDYISRKTA